MSTTSWIIAGLLIFLFSFVIGFASCVIVMFPAKSELDEELEKLYKKSRIGREEK